MRKCSATKSTTLSSSRGLSKTILNLPKKQRTINTTIPSGNNSNNSPYSIRQPKSCLILFFYLFPLDLLSRLYFPTLSTSSLYLFYESSFSITQKKDTSCYLTLPAAHKCSAIKSTMPNTSPGSSRTIPPLPKKQRTINTTIPSGNNSNNSPYSIRQPKSCLILFFYLFPLDLLSRLYFPTLSTSSLYLFYESSFSITQKKIQAAT